MDIVPYDILLTILNNLNYKDFISFKSINKFYYHKLNQIKKRQLQTIIMRFINRNYEIYETYNTYHYLYPVKHNQTYSKCYFSDNRWVDLDYQSITIYRSIIISSVNSNIIFTDTDNIKSIFASGIFLLLAFS